MKKRLEWTSLRILLVDRDLEFRLRLRSLLRRHDVAEVLSSGESVAAVEMIRRRAFDAVVVELAEDGAMDFLRRIRRLPPSDAPALLVLAESEGDYRIAVARKVGIDGVLVKPVLPEEVVEALAGLEPLSVSRPEETEQVPSARPSRLRARAGITPGKASSTGGTGFELASAPLPSTGGIGPGTYLDPLDPEDKPSSLPAIEIEVPSPSSPAKAREPSRQDEGEEAEESGDEDSSAFDLEKVLAGHADWLANGGARGRRANLEGRELEGSQLAGAVLADALMASAVLIGADLSGADLHGADLRRAELQGATLSGCNFAVARMRHARLAGCRLDGANLKGADLAGADLAGALFDDAILDGANFLQADLRGADLSRATGLSSSQLANAEVDPATRLPPGIRRPSRDEE